MNKTTDGGLSVHFASASVEWETPPEVFDPLNAEFGFTLDVCARPETAKCRWHFTPEMDGLSRDWSMDICWMNPPYGRQIAAWMEKAYNESQKGATVVCLVPSRTDTQWWHKYAMKADERRFIEGRVRFLTGGKQMTHTTRAGPTPAPFPCALVVFRPPAQMAGAA